MPYQLSLNFSHVEVARRLAALRKILLADDSSNFVQQILHYLHDHGDNDRSSSKTSNAKVGIDFSSPNIAKPFHVGHLRSAFIGRFISNLLRSSGTDVVRINYLGDWGTQFGLLAAGFNKFCDDRQDVNIKRLYDVYVQANYEAKNNPAFESEARHFFSSMESGDQKALEFWNRVRQCSIDYLQEFYDRLNISFDVWQSESQFANAAKNFIAENIANNLLERAENGLIGLNVQRTKRIANGSNENCDNHMASSFIPLARSDFTSLYLTRDVAAAIYRADLMKLDRIYYVVDNDQHGHFIDLQGVLKLIGREDVAERITHVKFGIIREMSTREGKSVFVEDMIRQGETIAMETMRNASTTKVKEEDFLKVAPIMAITAFLINDAKRKRTIGYSYDWTKILTPSGLGGYFLQACHARLCSLEDLYDPKRNIDLSQTQLERLKNFLTEPEAINLLSHLLDNCPKALSDSLNSLDASPLVKYLLDLARMSNAAHKKLKVLGSNEEIADARMLLFSTSRMLLARCLKLLGVEPLHKV